MEGRAYVACLLLSLAPAVGQTIGARAPAVAGRVSEAGEPVAGARVVARWYRHPELPPSIAQALGEPLVAEATGTSDERGMFRLDVPSGVALLVTASTPAGRRTSPRFPLQARDFVELRVQDGSVIEGTVRTADGEPVAGAVVETASYSTPAALADKYRIPCRSVATRSGDDGRFLLDVPNVDPAGATHALRSLRARIDERSSTGRYYRIDGQSICDVDLALTRGSVLRGKVVDAERVAVAGATILDPLDWSVAAKSGADGRFDLPGFSGQIAVTTPDHVTALMEPVDRLDDCLVVLVPGVRVRARLLGEEGPMAQRRVLFARPYSAPGPMLHLAWLAHTDDEGRVETTAVPQGDTVCAFVEVDGRFVQVLATRETWEDRDLGEVLIGRGRAVAGQVLDTSGQPLRDARVLLRPKLTAPEDDPPRNPEGDARNWPLLPYHVTYTDRGGRFRFDGVPSGPIDVVAQGDSHGVAAVSLGAGQATTALEFRLGQGLAVQGRATGPDGRPVIDAQVQYIVTAPTGASELIEWPIYLHGRTDADGRFTFRGVPTHGSYTCYAFTAKGERAWLGMSTGSFDPETPIAVELAPHDGRY